MSRVVELDDTPRTDYFKSDRLLAQALAGSLTKLRENDRAFGQKMLESIRQWSRFTDKQRVVVERLIDRAENGYPKNVELESDLTAVNALLDTALANGLKYPKLHLTVGDGPLVISRCGDRSKTPGALNVTDGGPFDQNVWYGRVKDGQYQPNGRLPSTVVLQIGSVLNALAINPLAVICGHGHMTGHCACCGRQLTDPKSVRRGVGPVCATRWGLA